MKFIGRFQDATEEIRVTELGNGTYAVEVDGVTHQVDARRFMGGTWSLVIDNQSYDVELEVTGDKESDGKFNALVRGMVVPLEMLDERRARMGRASAKFAVEGPQTVATPMPGKVVKILVATGEDVEEGQPLLIIEAMKMENEIVSPKKGKIGAITVQPGQAVESGADLVIVE